MTDMRLAEKVLARGLNLSEGEPGWEAYHLAKDVLELRAGLEKWRAEAIRRTEELDEQRQALKPEAGREPSKCPDCYGKGLSDQDDAPGIWLNVDGSTTECPTCRGSGAEAGRELHAEGLDERGIYGGRAYPEVGRE